MSRFCTYITVVIFSLFLSASSSLAQGQAVISEIQARLFHSKTGTFSENILAKGAPELGNVPSGDLASVSTFIVVKISFGANGTIPRTSELRLIATESATQPFGARSGKQVLLNSASKLGPADTEGNTFVGFWLNRTGCKSITLKATLIGAGKVAAVSEVLPFACYE